jgi:CRISPR-associated protein Csb3
MAEAAIPVDLRNPGQVFACLGLMEAAEILTGQPAFGAYDYEAGATNAAFRLLVEGDADPVATVLSFLAGADASSLTWAGSNFATEGWGVPTQPYPGEAVFPFEEPDSPAPLPVRLKGAQRHAIPIEHWGDSARTGRDNVKFWAGSGGYPGAALARDALALVAELGGNALTAAAADPFAVEARMSSSFGFDWRRSYVPLDAGFSPNSHAAVKMIGFPIVELLSAIGLQNARPHRIDKLTYRYGLSSVRLPTTLARAVLGGQGLGFPIRLFRMRLGWPGQEGQARCIIDAHEESAP